MRAARAAAQCSSEASIREIEEGVGALQRLLADEQRRLTRAGHAARIIAEKELSGASPRGAGRKKRGSFLDGLAKGLKGKLGGGGGGISSDQEDEEEHDETAVTAEAAIHRNGR